MVINRNKKQDGKKWLNQHSGEFVKGIGVYVRESGETSSGPLIDDHVLVSFYLFFDFNKFLYIIDNRIIEHINIILFIEILSSNILLI